MDVFAAQATLAKEPAFAGLINPRSGLRLMHPACIVEESFSFLCTSNNHLSRILKLVDEFALMGEGMEEVDGHLFRQFPTLSKIADTSEENLRSRGFGYRAKTIPLAARQILDHGGIEFLNRIKQMDHCKSREELMKLPGVGPKLADCICLYALHQNDSVPVDTHIWNAAISAFFPEWAGQKLNRGRYEIVAQKFRDSFGDLAGYAQLLLFHDQLINWRAYRR